MRRVAYWAGAWIALVAATSQAQTAPPGTPDVPGGEGTLRGQIVNTSRPGAIAGLPVLLYALPESAPPGVREGVSDARGSFVFTKVSNDPGTVYLVGVRAGEVPFGVRVQFEPGERERSLTLPISDPTSDASGVGIDTVVWQLERGCDSLHISESHRLRNPGSRVIYVPESERSGRAPLFRSTLPEDADQFEGQVGMFNGGLVREGRDVVFWGPVYPGEQTLEFSWALPASAPTLAFERRLDAGAKRLSVRTPAGATAPQSPRLGDPRSVTEDGLVWREQTAGSFAPGDSFALSIELPPPLASDRIALGEARVWLELDDAALQVDEQIGLTVSQTTPLVSESGAPLLCLVLPQGATGLRFASQTLDLGLAAEASGRLAVRGPLPPGPSVFALRYHLPTADGAHALALQFPLRLPQLSVFVTDTGVRADATRLHRRRPFRSDDRSYMHLEAFELDANEPVSLSLARLAPQRPLPMAARAGFALLLAAAATAFLIAPLRSSRSEPPLVSRQAAHARAEREAVFSALRDLDEDFATEKLDAADHAQMRADLRARAAGLLAVERDTPMAPDAVPAPSPAACPGCATTFAAGARFCSNCGISLAAHAGDTRAPAG